MSESTRTGQQARALTEDERRELARLVSDWVLFGRGRQAECSA